MAGYFIKLFRVFTQETKGVRWALFLKFLKLFFVAYCYMRWNYHHNVLLKENNGINSADIGTNTHRFGVKKTLDDILSHRQYQDMYQEMLRVTHESKETSDEDETRLRRIVGEDNYKLFQGGVSRRRGGPSQRSAVGRRRARSQVIRREKLNSQGLRSHMQHTHTKQAYDYSSDASQ